METMTNIIEFPSTTKKELSLLKTQEELSELYAALNKCYEVISQLENQTAEKEAEYSSKLQRYKLENPSKAADFCSWESALGQIAFYTSEDNPGEEE